MNPMMIASVANSSATKKIALGLGIVVVGLVIYFFVIKPYLKKQEELKVGSDVNSQIAMSIKDSVGWFKNKEALLNIARQGMDFEAVSKAYSNLTGGKSMVDDVRGKLNQEEFSQFMMLVKQNPKSTGNNLATANSYKSNTDKNKTILVTSDCTAYNPQRKATFGYYPLKKFKSGDWVEGTTSGFVLTTSSGNYVMGAAQINGVNYPFMFPQNSIKLLTMAEVKSGKYKLRFVKWGDATIFSKGTAIKK